MSGALKLVVVSLAHGSAPALLTVLFRRVGCVKCKNSTYVLRNKKKLHYDKQSRQNKATRAVVSR